MSVFETDDQAKWNRFLLVVTAAFVVAGFGNNILRSVGSELSFEVAGLVGIVTIGAMILATSFAVCFGVVRGPSTLVTWGFVIDRRLWIRLVLALLSVLIVIPKISGTSWFLGIPQIVSVGTVTMEEMFFRGILISTLLSIVQPKGRWGVAGLICATAVVFAVMHIPTKNAAGLFGVFAGGIFLGYVFYYTRSLLLPIFVHVVANTAEKAGPIGGVVAIVAYFVVAGLVHIWARSRRAVEVQAT